MVGGSEKKSWLLSMPADLRILIKGSLDRCILGPLSFLSTRIQTFKEKGTNEPMNSREEEEER